jgi:hypothetical protein
MENVSLWRICFLYENDWLYPGIYLHLFSALLPQVSNAYKLAEIANHRAGLCSYLELRFSARFEQSKQRQPCVIMA